MISHIWLSPSIIEVRIMAVRTYFATSRNHFPNSCFIFARCKVNLFSLSFQIFRDKNHKTTNTLGVLKITLGVLKNTFGVTTITLRVSYTAYCNATKRVQAQLSLRLHIHLNYRTGGLSPCVYFQHADWS